LIGNAGAPNAVFLNENRGKSWKKVTLKDQDFYTYDIIIADLNADGWPEILESNSDEVNFFYGNIFGKK